MAIATCAALSVAVTAAAPSHVSAQTCSGTACTPVRPDGKGMIGLGLLGGEIGLFVPALIQNAAHTNEWWPYLVFPLVGIGAGIGGGYALETATGGWGTSATPDAGPSIGILFGAAVLIVPTIVGTLALAAYTPPSESATPDEDMEYDDTSESGDSVEAVQDDGSSSSASPDSSSGSSSGSGSGSTSSSSGGTSLLPTRPSDVLAGGPGLLRLDTDGHRVLLGIPMLGSLARYSSEELSSLQLVQQYDLNLPLVSATF